MATAKQEKERQERHQDGGAAPPSEVLLGLADKHAKLAKMAEDKFEGVDLGEADGVLRNLLQTLAEDKAQSGAPPPPAGPGPASGGTADPQPAGGVAGGFTVAPEDRRDFSSETVDAAMAEFGGDCPDKRKLLEQFAERLGKKQRMG